MLTTTPGFGSIAEMIHWIPNIIGVCDPHGGVSYLNHQWYRFTGRSHPDDRMSHVLDIVHPDDRQRLRELWRTGSGDDREAFKVELRLRSADNVYRWFLVHAQPVYSEDRSLVSWLATATDIHEQKTQEESLRQAKEAAEQADQMKTYFLANMSHEIRTPLGAILGFSELLAEDGLPSTEKQEFLQVIERSGKNLIRIVDDILDLSKVEAGCLEVERVDVDPRSVIEETVALFKETACIKGLSLHMAYDGQVPQKICTDPTRLVQILSNLLSNAIKFTEEGGIHIHATTELDSDTQWFVISIRDTGVGIRQDQIRQLFRPFAQAEPESGCRRHSGSGLGLALSRRLAEAMGGRLEIQSSELGTGTCISLRLPASCKT